MNYRHHYHAGNFADLVKHAALLSILGAWVRGAQPVTVIDTHAGAGLYDLSGEMARKSGEADRGVARLMSDAASPAVFAALKAAVAAANAAGPLRVYPGSPWLAQNVLRGTDRLTAYELRADDAQALQTALGGRTDLKLEALDVVCGDGFAAAPLRQPDGGLSLTLIDPPFERSDDYARIVTCLGAILARNSEAAVMVWSPLKDLETFDGLLRGIETVGAPATLVAEARLRRLDDPLRLNGCALCVINPPAGLAADLRDACGWVVGALGEPGGEARIWTL